MDNDNLYPNSGAYFAEPKTQVNEREKEIAETLAAIPLLDEFVAYLDERIAFYGSNDAIDPSVLTNPEAFMHIVAGNKVAKDNLEVERNYVLQRILTAAKR